MTVFSAPDASIDAKRILGSANTGKTDALIKELIARIEGGADANRIAVFVPSPQAATELEERLKTAASTADADVTGVVVGTPHTLALRILDTDFAYAVTGRRPRLLSPIEMDCLFEDLKVSGIRESRIRKMVGFFFRSLSELTDDDPQWLSGAEEDDLYGLLERNLDFMEAVAEAELSNLARKVLMQAKASSKEAEDTGAAPSFGFDHVFVDDYQMLSRASQHLCCLLARKSLCICANPLECVQSSESYPYGAGVEEFSELFPHFQSIELSVCHQAKSIQEALRSLIANERLESMPFRVHEHASEGRVDVIVSSSPIEEFDAIAHLVSETLENGSCRDIVIAAPSVSWSAQIASTLLASGIDARTHEATRPWNAGITADSGNQMARLLCALRLVADPQDFPAWRTWCGFGDSMANSAAFDEIRRASSELRVSFIEALDLLSRGLLTLRKGSLWADRAVAAFREGRALCESARNLRGIALLDYLACCAQRNPQAKAPRSFVRLCGADEALTAETASAQALFAHAMQSFEGPLPHGEGSVAVLTYREAVGTKSDMLVIAGFVNGFIPKSDWFDLTKTPFAKQPEFRAADARLIAALIGSSRKSLYFSAFNDSDLETALRLKLKVDRIRTENGERMAKISPSIFLESTLGSIDGRG